MSLEIGQQSRPLRSPGSARRAAGWARSIERWTLACGARSRSRCCPTRPRTTPTASTRFDRETRAVAALNHPNILAIHDTGSLHAIPYAVTELLEGETLADRLRTGPLAHAKAVDVACQVADGLAAAHARGIIHRDIKPDNIFLTNEGRAKILDFGIARIEQPARTPGIAGPTARRGSSSQFLVGTAGYMSPEQVRGKPIDARTDIFSLGATFYEMLTGRRAFSRDTPVETLGAVLRDDPRKHPETEKIPEELQGFVFRSPREGPGRPLSVGPRPAPRSSGLPGRAGARGRRGASTSGASLPGSTAGRASFCAPSAAWSSSRWGCGRARAGSGGVRRTRRRPRQRRRSPSPSRPGLRAARRISSRRPREPSAGRCGAREP